jgi:archaeosine synthase
LTRKNSEVGISHVTKETILHCNSHASLDNPVVTKWIDYIIEEYKPPVGLDNVLMLLPCSARKPYRMSKSHRKFLEVIGHSAFHEVMVTSPLGLVPRDLEETWPASHYDIPVTGEWSLDEIRRTKQMLTSLIEKNNYHTVINHSSMTFDLAGVNYYETRIGHSATSRAALDKLREVAAEVSKESVVRNRKHHKILLDNFCSIARYKMENDIWLNDVKIRGKPPFWRIEREGKQVALWSNDRRGFSLAKSSIPIIAQYYSLKKIHLKSEISWKGDIFSNILIDYDAGINSGDDLLVLQDDKAVGLARATASGWEWSTTPGMVAKGHQRL